ncbi:myoD family inhibitor [Nothobranchius furzeri]|uniref:MyoD family inhibitor-like n=1 Tax=Nothobranchius furzeri TaxID=105023 RepID=A0A1A7ZSN1_NOTFU|nr:myoD family inhibitor-like [Nothobranchius furzeri]
MEVKSPSENSRGGANKDCDQSNNGMVLHHNTGQAPPPTSDRLQEANSSEELSLSESSTDERAHLLPALQTDLDTSSEPPDTPCCVPPTSSSISAPPVSQSSFCNQHHHQDTNQTTVSSNKCHTSFNMDAAHIKKVAGDDCFVHCLLSCLFCELLSICSAVGDCLLCGLGSGGSCDALIGCCVDTVGEAACTEEVCQAVLDCGILENCCGSAECLEICLECCSIIFPS